MQVKENQPILCKQCQDFAVMAAPLSSHTEREKGHGRLTTREGQCFAMRGLHWAARWSDRGLHTLGVIQRQTLTLAKQKTTEETAYSHF